MADRIDVGWLRPCSDNVSRSRDGWMCRAVVVSVRGGNEQREGDKTARKAESEVKE